MSRSIRSGLRLIAACPYQYASGRSWFEARCVGAEDAAHPSVVAGVEVWMGDETGAAAMTPGTAQPP